MPLHLGYVLFDDITFHRPQAGAYTLTYASDALTPVVQDIVITAGYPAQLDVCNGRVVQDVPSLTPCLPWVDDCAWFQRLKLNYDETPLTILCFRIQLAPIHDGNGDLIRDATTGYCQEPKVYESNVQVTLRDMQINLLDAGRVFTSTNWNSETRNVTVVVESYTDVFGQVYQFSKDGSAAVDLRNPLTPDLGGVQLVEAGADGQCSSRHQMRL